MNKHAQVGLYQIDENTPQSHMKQSDQQIRRQQPVSPLEESVLIPGDEWEEDFEDDLVFFISNLEQQMARLLEMNSRHQSSVTMRFLAEMVNHAATFSEGVSRTKANTHSLQEALNNLAPIYPELRTLKVRGNRLLVETIVDVGNEDVGWGIESLSSVNQICQGGILVLEHYFSFFETLFNSIDAQERWKEVCNTFIAELKQIVAEDEFGDVLKQ